MEGHPQPYHVRLNSTEIAQQSLLRGGIKMLGRANGNGNGGRRDDPGPGDGDAPAAASKPGNFDKPMDDEIPF